MDEPGHVMLLQLDLLREGLLVLAFQLEFVTCLATAWRSQGLFGKVP